MTKDEALALVKTEWWKFATDRQIAEFQLNESRLCMPFGEFQLALERVLGRDVQSIEMAMDRDGLKRELMGERAAPSVEQILALLPDHVTPIVISQ